MTKPSVTLFHQAMEVKTLKITAPVTGFIFASAFDLTFTANNDFLLGRAVLPALAFLAFSCLIDEGSG